MTGLLLVSGAPRQMALHALSAHAVELPPLGASELRRAVGHAFDRHLGETVAVRSDINGGGKTHWIHKQVAELQSGGDGGGGGGGGGGGADINYMAVPLRASTTPARLVAKLARAGGQGSTAAAVHIDVGHVIPQSANTSLFQLLVVGVLRATQARVERSTNTSPEHGMHR